MDTIFALSSGNPPSGVAVVRVSGPKTSFVLNSLISGKIDARKASLKTVTTPDGLVIDNGLVIWFPRPNSFTGEDCLEFQIHGGLAVVSALLETLGKFEGCRLAEAGEFSKRAFENGKFDLTELEGLSDLIASETEMQRRQALDQAGGKLRNLYQAWREELIRQRAYIEAELDFADEDDVPGGVSGQVWRNVKIMSDDISAFLRGQSSGEIVRNGFKVTLAGPPNAGKSSLLNALVSRDAAIVTEEAGTTRDLIEARLDVEGFLVLIVDTAGIRTDVGVVEAEGIRRAKAAAKDSDLVFWLEPMGSDSEYKELPENYVRLVSKDDQNAFDGLSVSVGRQDSISELLSFVHGRINREIGGSESGVVTRQRHRAQLSSTSFHLERAADIGSEDIVKAAEEMRIASDELGKLSGSVDVEDLLDVIFSEFCVGK